MVKSSEAITTLLSLHDVCVFHLYTIAPMQMLAFTTQWDIAKACEYHTGMSIGNAHEQSAAKNLSIMEVYQIMQSFMAKEGQYADEDVLGAYVMEQAMYERLRCYLGSL